MRISSLVTANIISNHPRTICLWIKVDALGGSLFEYGSSATGYFGLRQSQTLTATFEVVLGSSTEVTIDGSDIGWHSPDPNAARGGDRMAAILPKAKGGTSH